MNPMVRLAALLGLAGAAAEPSRPAFDVNDFGPMPRPEPPRPAAMPRRTKAQKKKRAERHRRKRNRGW